METQNIGQNEGALEEKEGNGLRTSVFLLSLMAVTVLVAFFFLPGSFSTAGRSSKPLANKTEFRGDC